MTSEQAAWLKANPQYRPIGVSAGHAGYQHRGTLAPDGTFTKATKGVPVSEEGGCFGVGVPVNRDPSQPWRPGEPAPVTDPRGYVGNWNEGGTAAKKV